MTTSTYALIEGERHRLADLADGWIPEQWDVPSLAEGWRVREVVAHLTMPFAVGMPGLVIGLLRHRGSFDRFADRWARDATAVEPAEHVAALRANAAARFTPPGMGPEAPLTDLVVHGLDVRIPLGLPATDLDHDALAATLRFLATRSARHFGVPADAFATRRLEATDVDWSHGTGPTERAPATDLIAHLCRARPLPQM
jgi:uncharacterized protein (TIGR03083 family)